MCSGFLMILWLRTVLTNVLILHATQEKTAFRLSRRHVALESERIGRERERDKKDDKKGQDMQRGRWSVETPSAWF